MSKWIDDWRPNDPEFWQATGRKVARRNLGFSIFAEFLGFSIWQIWAVVAARLPDAGFDLSTSQLFWLVAIPGLVGATARFGYTFAPARFGGRNWTVVSAILLLIPTTLLAVLVSDPTTPYWMLLGAAATAGFGGGNFASSMANISYFFPERRKGAALGMNAAGGNIGVAAVLGLVPLVIGFGGGLHLERAALVWMPLILLAAICAFFFMDNLRAARSTFNDQRQILNDRDTWVMSILYIATFGSFIGYSAGLPLLIKTQFPEQAVQIAFLGPLVGSLARPFGGMLADRIGGARMIMLAFPLMSIATVGLVGCLAHRHESWAFGAFLATFMVLFILSGIANGGSFRMVPAIWVRKAAARGDGPDDPRCKRETAAVLGFISAVAAYGGFYIPQAYNGSISLTGGPSLALLTFSGFYLVAAAVTWVVYVRRPATTPLASGRALTEGRI